ncbi:MAG: amidohydrolase family protein [Chloroflexi bacterium]|nr:amidohydrolase family protein [Chloroflexota bacterium]
MIQSAIVDEFLTTGQCASCRVIDLHAHYGPYQGIYMPNHTPEQMIATLDRCGVERMVTSGHMALADMVPGNQEITELTERYPTRWSGYTVINPNYPELAARELALYDKRKGMVGLKFHPSGHRYPLDGPNYAPALEFAAERRLMVLSHTWEGPFNSVAEVTKVAEAYPTLDLILGHSIYGEWDGAIALAKRLPNVYLELTAAYAANGIIEKMSAGGVTDKVVFGCDLPWFDPHYAIGCIIFARISESERRMILRETALRLITPRLRH